MIIYIGMLLNPKDRSSPRDFLELKIQMRGRHPSHRQ